MFLKRGKKGISPLIATVLLIAFAVSIGVLIMTWGNNAYSTVGDCNLTRIAIQTRVNQSIFCYDRSNNKIIIAAKNTGEVDIEALKIMTTGEDNAVEESVIADSKIKIGSAMSKTVDFGRTDNFKAELIPIIMYSGQQRACINQEITADPLPDCN